MAEDAQYQQSKHSGDGHLPKKKKKKDWKLFKLNKRNQVGIKNEQKKRNECPLKKVAIKIPKLNDIAKQSNLAGRNRRNITSSMMIHRHTNTNSHCHTNDDNYNCTVSACVMNKKQKI